MQFKSLSLAALIAAVLGSPAWAHHSHGAYVAGPNATHLEGTVKEVQMINPHSWIYLEVKNDKGETSIWALEATNPIGLARAGVKKGDLRPGDTIKVRCNQLRDGSNGCLLGFVTPTHGDKTRGDGVERDWDGPRAGADPRDALAK
jgi:Family of unknown function (DUF6152)